MLNFLKNLFISKSELESEISEQVRIEKTLDAISKSTFFANLLKDKLPEGYSNSMVDAVWQRLKCHNDVVFTDQEIRLYKASNYINVKLSISKGKIILQLNFAFSYDGELEETSTYHNICDRRNPNLKKAMDLFRTFTNINDELYLLSLFIKEKDDLIKLQKQKELDKFENF